MVVRNVHGRDLTDVEICDRVLSIAKRARCLRGLRFSNGPKTLIKVEAVVPNAAALRVHRVLFNGVCDDPDIALVARVIVNAKEV